MITACLRKPTVKAVFFVFLCLFVVAVQGQTGDKKTMQRTIKAPSHFFTAEQFLDLSETDRVVYVQGLMDGFFASAMFGASDEPVAGLNSCVEHMDGRQISAIITKHVKDHPESWNQSLSVQGPKPHRRCGYRRCEHQPLPITCVMTHRECSTSQLACPGRSKDSHLTRTPARNSLFQQDKESPTRM